MEFIMADWFSFSTWLPLYQNGVATSKWRMCCWMLSFKSTLKVKVISSPNYHGEFAIWGILLVHYTIQFIRIPKGQLGRTLRYWSCFRWTDNTHSSGQVSQKGSLAGHQGGFKHLFPETWSKTKLMSLGTRIFKGIHPFVASDYCPAIQCVRGRIWSL